MVERKSERRQVLDPAVADLLKGMQQKQSESQLPRKERERLSRERAKIQARRDMRATYDLPPSIREEIRELAERNAPACQSTGDACAFAFSLRPRGWEFGSFPL